MPLTPYCASLQMSTLAVLTSAQLSTSCSPSLRSPRAMFVKPPLRPPPLPFLRHSSEPSHLSLTVVRLGGSANGCQCFCTPLKLALTRSRGRPVLAGESITGVIFEPFEELKNREVSLVPAGHDQSLARQKYTDVCETAINTQINVEYNASYAYHSLFAYFDRDNVALKGFAKFFKESSKEEKKHAEKLMKYQNKRGGKVKLLPIVMPLTDFDHHEKGDALYAMELALSLEKLTNEKLLNLHNVAQNCNDAQMTDFVQNEFLGEQVKQLKRSLDMSLSSEDWAKAMEFGISIKCFSMKEVMDKLYF